MNVLPSFKKPKKAMEDLKSSEEQIITSVSIMIEEARQTREAERGGEKHG